MVLVEEQVDGDVTHVSLKDAPKPAGALFEGKNKKCSLCTCDVPVKIRYTDVLILEQFMREDGTVLPKELTGSLKFLDNYLHVFRAL